MTKPKNKTPASQPPPEPEPILKGLVLQQHGSRYEIHYLEIQGDRVITREKVSACPEVPPMANRTFRVECVKRLKPIF